MLPFHGADKNSFSPAFVDIFLQLPKQLQDVDPKNIQDEYFSDIQQEYHQMEPQNYPPVIYVPMDLKDELSTEQIDEIELSQFASKTKKNRLGCEEVKRQLFRSYFH